MSTLLALPSCASVIEGDFHLEQRKDPKLKKLIDYLEKGTLPSSDRNARRVAMRALNFIIIDKILYLVDGCPQNKKLAAVPCHLQKQILRDYHGSQMAGHFSSNQLYNTYFVFTSGGGMVCIPMLLDTVECAIAMRMGRRKKPPLHPHSCKKTISNTWH